MMQLILLEGFQFGKLARSEKRKEVITLLRLYKASWKNRDIS